MTTTSSGAATVWEWIENWLQTEHPEWRINVTPVTTAYASMNVAGPSSRLLLQRLVKGIDLSPGRLPLHDRSPGDRGRGRLLHVAHRIHRRALLRDPRPGRRTASTSGRHCSSSDADLKLAPFGSRSPAHHASGEGSLHRRTGHRRSHARLFRRPRLADQARQGRLRRQDRTGLAASRQKAFNSSACSPWIPTVVPPEASQIIENGNHIAGRITSSRFSPTLGRSICLAVVAPHLAGPGNVGDDPAARPQPGQGEGDGHTTPTSIRKEPGSVFDSPVARSPIAQIGPIEIPRWLGGVDARSRRLRCGSPTSRN